MIVRFSEPASFYSRSLAVCGWIVVVLGGCGGGDAVESGLVPVKGRVTRDGGAWPSSGAIYFMPKDSTKASPMGVGTFDTSGNFDSVEGGYGGAKGLHPGFYWISIQCKEGDEEMPIPGKPDTVKNHVPKKYQNPETSGFTLEVEQGKPAVANFNVLTK